jgi:hypothetical protein
LSVQYGSLSGSIASTPKSVAGIKSGPNQVVKCKTSISRRSVTIWSGLDLLAGILTPLKSEFSFSPEGKNAGHVNLSAKILRRVLVVLTVLARTRRPYHTSPAVKMNLFWLVPFRLNCVPVIAMAQDVTGNFERDVNFSQYKTYKWINIEGATSPN